MYGDNEHLKERRLIFYKDDIDRINRVLEEFLKLSDSKCNILIDKEGHMVTKAGYTADFDMQTISALVAGSFAATKELAKLIGEDEFSVLFHQGKKDNIQLTLISERTILTTIFDERTTIGMVRLYTKEAQEKLSKIFDEIFDRKLSTEDTFADQDFEPEGFTSSVKNKLDDFFDD